jgi:mannose/cellobiose epimerase-like protein (N-acyl-D-glucosamine 2-epimerase family)
MNQANKTSPPQGGLPQTSSPAPAPDWWSEDFLLGHIRSTMAFYHPRAVDPTGGFFHFFKDDGQVFDATTRHLVSSTRFVFNYAMAFRQFGDAAYQQATWHGLQFLRNAHRNSASGGYRWQLRWEAGHATSLDDTNHCYGCAFVLLAYAHGVMAGFEEATAWLNETFELMEQRFWEPRAGLYADEADANWQLSAYRGQNANMHACEALLSAFEATGQQRFLDRAETIARNITQRQAALADGLIWEHYHRDWSVDWDYNRFTKNNLFRPWGFQTGHLSEWAKLLLILERHRPMDWLAPRAIELFDVAMLRGWDVDHGGLVYGFDTQGQVCDGDKYFWVQAESLAAAALLSRRTRDARYNNWYQQLWQYSWQHFVDHVHGAWWRILGPDNRKLDDEKSPAGKTDYHTMGACYEVLHGALTAGFVAKSL